MMGRMSSTRTTYTAFLGQMLSVASLGAALLDDVDFYDVTRVADTRSEGAILSETAAASVDVGGE